MAASDVTKKCYVLWASFGTCRDEPSVVIGFKVSEACVLQVEDGQPLLCYRRIVVPPGVCGPSLVLLRRATQEASVSQRDGGSFGECLTWLLP